MLTLFLSYIDGSMNQRGWRVRVVGWNLATTTDQQSGFANPQ